MRTAIVVNAGSGWTVVHFCPLPRFREGGRLKNIEWDRKKHIPTDVVRGQPGVRI